MSEAEEKAAVVSMKYLGKWLRLSLLALVAVGQNVSAQNEDSVSEQLEQIKEQLNVLREEQLKLRQEMNQYGRFFSQLQARQAQAQGAQHNGKKISVASYPYKGSLTSKLTLVEFSDYQ